MIGRWSGHRRRSDDAEQGLRVGALGVVVTERRRTIGPCDLHDPGGPVAAQAGEPHPAVGSTAQLHTDGYGIGGLAVSVEASGQTDIQKPGH